MPTFDPNGLLDYAVYFIVACALVIPAWLSRGRRSLHADVAEIRDQTSNSHPTNMRDDIDRAIRLIEANTATTVLISGQLGEVHRHLIAHGDDIGDIRDEVGIERKARVALTRRVDGIRGPSGLHPEPFG